MIKFIHGAYKINYKGFIVIFILKYTIFVNIMYSDL